MKEGLIYISDRLGQLRYSDGNEKSRWLQPLSSYKALKTIKRGQAVSVATVKEIESILKDDKLEAYRSDPSPYIVPTNTKIHNRCIGLALENAELDDEVHILSSGQFEYDGTGISGKEYDPKFKTEEISKKVYVSNKEGELTTSSEVAYENYNNIIQIGHIIDVPITGPKNGTKQKTILEVQIQGDDRGILESTQFEAVLGEDVFIKADEPLTVFAFGQEDASKFKLRLCTRNMNIDDTGNTIDLNASFIIIKKLSGEYYLIKFSEEEINTNDTTDLSTLELLKNRYELKNTITVGNIDFNNSTSSIDTIIKALNNAIGGMDGSLSFGEPDVVSREDYSSATLELNENGGYYDIYISNSLREFLRDTVTLQNGSLNNKNTAVLADIRVDARRNVFGVLVNDYEKDTTLTKGSRILLMRQGELVVNTERSLPAVGKKFVLGESGAVICADDALRTADSSNTIGYLKKVHKEGEEKNHYHFVIDIGENIPKVEYSTYPVGYLKPYYGDKNKPTPDFGYLVTGGTYQIEDYEELYERLLGWYPENEIKVSGNGHDFNIPLITDKYGTPMQIKYVTDGIFERLPKVPYLRDFGNISKKEEHAYRINDLDITALLSINTTFSEVDTLPLERLDIHLYIDPGYTEGEHNWREVRPGFYKYNNVDTYGFEWELKKEVADGENIYGKYILSANIGDGRGIYYVSSNNVAPISCENVPYKLYVAVKQTNIEHFDLRNLMSNYISNTIYNVSGEVDDIYAVTGEAVVNAIRNNKWFNTLKNFNEEAVIDFGGEKKLDTTVNIQTNKAIKLNCKVVSEEPEETQGNAVLIGETVDNENNKKYTTLEIKDGKAFLNKLNDNLFKFENGQLVSARNEVATVNDILDHALMSIDNNISVEDVLQSSAGYAKGRIHGMIFGEGGNVDASTLCNFKVGIAHGQTIQNTQEALIPIIYKSGNDVHTPLQGYLDYYTNTVNDNETTKLFTLYPSYEPNYDETSDKLDLAFKKDDTNFIKKISFGGAKLVAETEFPSLSRYKKIYSESLLRGEEQFPTQLNEDSKPDKDDNISFDFAYILQAAYELPMAYWKYRDSSEYNIGPIIERLQDTIKYFETAEDNTIEYEVDGEKHKYTPEEQAGIAKSLKDIISESGKSVRVDDMVGFLLAAAGETQKRLASLERSTYGKDVMADIEEIKFDNLDGVNSDHTYYGLNRLVRAICLELFGKANPEELTADEATLTSLSRMDDIERQIRGSRNTPDEKNGSITNNSINDFGNASAEGYSISSSYPYKEDIEKNLESIKDEDDTLIGENSITNTKETIFGDTKAKDPDSFNGVVDAIYRITQKVDVLTEAINGTNDILQPHTTLNKIKRNIETLIQEVYFDGAKECDEAYKDILSNHELYNGENPSRVDEITKELYYKVLDYNNWGDTQDNTKSEVLEGYKGATYNSDNRKLTIESPTNIDEYENISIIDIILKAIGNQILLKHYSEQDCSVKERRFNKDISERLYEIEQCLDNVVLRLKDSANFENFTNITFNDENTTLNIDAFSEALSGLLGYKYSTNGNGTDGKFAPSKGVVPGSENNSDKFSAEYALRTKSNIVAGLENILYRVQNEEKDNLRIKEVLGDELMEGVSIKATEADNGEQDTQTIEPIDDAKNFNLSDDIKDLLATIYGEALENPELQKDAGDNTYYRHRTKARVSSEKSSFLNGGNIIEKIVNELYYIPRPFNGNFINISDDESIDDNTIYVNHNANVDNTFFKSGSLINGINRKKYFEESGRKSRLDILESDVKALRNFIGLTGILDDTNANKDVKKIIAVDGDFKFEVKPNSNNYYVFGKDYAIGEKDPLTSSFIESFFNLMKRVDSVVISIKDIEKELDTKATQASLNEKFDAGNIIKSDATTEPDDSNVYSAKKVDNLFNASNGEVTSLNTRIGLAETRVSDLEKIIGESESSEGLIVKVNSLVKTVGTSNNDGLQKAVSDLNDELATAKDEVSKYKAKSPLIISSNILKVAAEEALGNNFTVSGNTHIYITPNQDKTYYCNVSFILDPDCEFIGSKNQEARRKNINSAIKQIMPNYFNKYNENPTWKDINAANEDTNAYVVYNRNFSNIVITESLSMGVDTSNTSDTNSIYCGISEDIDSLIGCKGNITKVGCIMSDLVISENDVGKQYSPFYFELVYVPNNYVTSGNWKFSWDKPEPEPETPSEP